MTEETVLRQVIGYNGIYRLEKFTNVLQRPNVSESKKPVSSLQSLDTGCVGDALLDPNIQHDESTNKIYGVENECYIAERNVPGNSETIHKLLPHERYAHFGG